MHSHRPKGARFFQNSRLKIEKRISFWSPVCCGQDNFLLSDNSSPNELWISASNYKVFLLVQLEFPIIQCELFCLKFTSNTLYLLCRLAKSQFQVTTVCSNYSLHSPTYFCTWSVRGGPGLSVADGAQLVVTKQTLQCIDSRIPIPIPGIRCWRISGPHV